jgi:hypothetical protein
VDFKSVLFNRTRTLAAAEGISLRSLVGDETQLSKEVEKHENRVENR